MPVGSNRGAGGGRCGRRRQPLGFEPVGQLEREPGAQAQGGHPGQDQVLALDGRNKRDNNHQGGAQDAGGPGSRTQDGKGAFGRAQIIVVVEQGPGMDGEQAALDPLHKKEKGKQGRHVGDGDPLVVEQEQHPTSSQHQGKAGKQSAQQAGIVDPVDEGRVEHCDGEGQQRRQDIHEGQPLHPQALEEQGPADGSAP